MSKSINISKLDEGFIVKDLETSLEYAATKERMIQKVKALLGITDKKKPVVKLKPKPKSQEPSDPITAPLAAAARGKPFIETGFVLKEITFPNNLTDLQEHKQGKMSWHVSKDSTAIHILREGYTPVELSVTDLKYLYDNPIAAKGIIQKFGEDVYQNKAVVLRAFLREIPYPKIYPEVPDVPVPEAPTPPPIPEVPEEKGSVDGTCDDIMFDSCANNSPENCKFCVNQGRFEDKKKLAAKKPAPRQMKVDMGVY